jgi:transposase
LRATALRRPRRRAKNALRYAHLCITERNALFAGLDLGAEGWAMHALLLETCKLNSVDPLAWLTDVLTKLVNLWPASRIDELMPWASAAKPR